jgi:hypothetical protein
VQFTVRLPRWVATTIAIVVASVAVATVLPAVANSDSTIVVCIDPTTKNLTVDPTCTGQVISWAQQGIAGTAGAAGATGPAGPAGPTAHLAKSKPSLVAKLETTLDVQAQTLRDVNGDVHASVVATSKLQPVSDPTVSALEDAVNVQGLAIVRLINVMKALNKAQGQLLQGIE